MWTDTCLCASVCICVHVRVSVRLCVCPRVNAWEGPAQESEGPDPALPHPTGFCFLLSASHPHAWCPHAIALPASRMAGRTTGPRLPEWRWKRPPRLSHIVVLNLTIPQSSQGRQEGAPADEVEGAPGPAPGEKMQKRGQQWAPPLDGEPSWILEADNCLRLMQVLELPEWPLRSRSSGLPWRRRRSRKTSSSRQTAGASPRSPNPQCVSSMGFLNLHFLAQWPWDRGS